MARPAVTMSRVALIGLLLSILLLLFSYGVPRAEPSAIPAKPPGNNNKEELKNGRPISTPDPFFHHQSTSEIHPAATETPAIPTELDDDERPQATPSTSTKEPPKPSSPPCGSLKHASEVMVILKTSSAEVFEKVPEQLLTLLSCTPNFAIFSDHSGTIAGHEIHDALKDVSPEVKAANKEFEIYDKVLQHGMERQQLDELKGDATRKLDKWKFLPMAYEAYKMRSEMKFYVFIEADTALSWTNLLQWIDRLDPRIPYYAGAPMSSNGIRFAQRGSGFLLSNAALKMYSKFYDQKYRSVWENQTAHECCGDVMLAKA